MSAANLAVRFACEVAAVVALWEVGQHALAIVFAVAAVGSALLVRVWPEPVPGP